MKKDQVKDLKKSPEKIDNKYEKETEWINSLLDKLKKSTVESELDEKINSELEKALKSCNKPFQLYVRGNILNNMKLEIGNQFIEKAKSLGLDVLMGSQNSQDGVRNINNLNEHIGIDSKISKLSDEYDTLENFISEDALNKIAEKLGFENAESAWKADPIFYSDLNPVNFRIATAHEIEIYYKASLSEALDSKSALKMKDMGKFPFKTFWDMPENKNKTIYFTQIDANEENGKDPLVDNCWLVGEMNEGDVENNGWNIYASPVTKQEALNKINEIVEKDANAVYVVSSDDEHNAILKEHRQCGVYNPNEIWNIFKSEEKAEKPEFNYDAVKNLIMNDMFLKFNYHELLTGDEEADIKMMYKNYIKGEQIYMNKLKTFESIFLREYASHNAKSIIANEITSALRNDKIYDNSDDLATVINTVCSDISKDIEDFKHNYDLATLELKVSFKNEISTMTKESIYRNKIKTPKLTLDMISDSAKLKELYGENYIFYKEALIGAYNASKKINYIDSRITSRVFGVYASNLLMSIS